MMVRRCLLASVLCVRSTGTAIRSPSREPSGQRRTGLSGDHIAAWRRRSVFICAMKFAVARPHVDPEAAARKLVESASRIEPMEALRTE